MTIRSYCVEEHECSGCGQVLTSAYVRWQLLHIQLNLCTECAISTGSGIKRDGNKIRDIAENRPVNVRPVGQRVPVTDNQPALVYRQKKGN